MSHPHRPPLRAVDDTPDHAAPHPDGIDAEVGIDGLIARITTGRHDHHLDLLSHAINERQRLLADRRNAQALASFEVGDRVRINHHARPLYLHAATGTVTGWVGQKIVVQLDHPVGRFTSGQLRCPPLILEPLSPE